jgi:hypothetical protein
MEPLCITDLEYGLHNYEIQSFGQFFSQTDIFLIKRKANTFVFCVKI